MKAKLKTPDVAKAKGFDFVKKTLKKVLKTTECTEPVDFLYDSEFDYGGDVGKKPLLYIGELTSQWKKYGKTVKASPTFLAGRCRWTSEGTLELERKIGKGAKAATLKAVNNGLLKPIFKASIVDTVDTPVSDTAPSAISEETPPQDDDNFVEVDVTDYIKEGNEYLKELKDQSDRTKALVGNIGPKVKDLSQVVVTDELISDGLKAKNELETIGLQETSSTIGTWLNDAKAVDSTNKELSAIVKNLESATATATTLWSKQVLPVVENINKLEKVQNPKEGEHPPVETNAGKAMETAFASLAKKSQKVNGGINKQMDKI